MLGAGYYSGALIPVENQNWHHVEASANSAEVRERVVLVYMVCVVHVVAVLAASVGTGVIRERPMAWMTPTARGVAENGLVEFVKHLEPDFQR